MRVLVPHIMPVPLQCMFCCLYNLSLSFSPTTKSPPSCLPMGNPVRSFPLSDIGYIIAPLAPFTNTISLSMTPCHSPHGLTMSNHHPSSSLLKPCILKAFTLSVLYSFLCSLQNVVLSHNAPPSNPSLPPINVPLSELYIPMFHATSLIK